MFELDSKMLILFTTAVFVGGAWTQSTGQCLPGWLKNGSSCYQFNAVKVDWFKATKLCIDQDAYLVKIEDAVEEMFLRRTIQSRHSTDDPQTLGYWTSGNDLVSEGKWVWGFPEGDNMTFTDWFPGEPNNIWYDKGSEDCVVMWGHDKHDYKWNDQPCEILDYYVCEMRLPRCTDWCVPRKNASEK